MSARLSEIGVAVFDGTKSGKELGQLLGLEPGMVLDAPEYGMRARMYKLGDVEFEFMEPLDDRGLIAGFLQKRGEGFHHIAFRVDDIIETLGRLRRAGFAAINAEPISVHGCKASFLHPAGFGGVLVELIEGTAEPVRSRAAISARLSAVSPSGVDAVEILAVGIVVDNAASAAETYAKAFEIEEKVVFFPSSFGRLVAVLRIGGVDLILLQMLPTDVQPGFPFTGRRSGLHHVVIRVENFDRARAFLVKHRLAVDPGFAGCGISSRCLLIKPSATSGMTLLLQKDAAAWPRLVKPGRSSGLRKTAGDTA